MEIFDIENNTYRLNSAVNAFKYLISLLGEKVEENYCLMNDNDERTSYYHELHSNIFLLNKIVEEFENIQQNFREQVELYYAKN